MVRVASIREVERENTTVLPSELWIIIFQCLGDSDRWALAKTCKRFLSIFENWVGFDSVVVYYANHLRSFTSKVTSNKDEIEESTEFGFYELSFPTQIDDIELVTGQRRQNLSWRSEWKYVKGQNSIHVFSTRPRPEGVPKEIDDDRNPRLAIIPLNPESPNKSFRGREILHFSDCTEQRFLSARWKVSSDKRFVITIHEEETNIEQLRIYSSPELSRCPKRIALW